MAARLGVFAEPGSCEVRGAAARRHSGRHSGRGERPREPAWGASTIRSPWSSSRISCTRAFRTRRGCGAIVPATSIPGTNKHLGSIIVANRGTAVQITATNTLPANHIIPVDHTIPGAEVGQAENRATIHLHGGLVPWVSDGGPYSLVRSERRLRAKRRSRCRQQPLQVRQSDLLADGQSEYYYPNNQGARMVWYHDHAIGITRINAYAGLASAYVITDDYEASLVTANNLPGPLDPRTKYLVFQDKIFVDSVAAMALKDPTWFTTMPNSRPGDLWYAHVYEPALWALGAGPAAAAAAATGVVHPGILWRHDPGQRYSRALPRGRAAPVPVPHAERLQRALPQPAPGLCRRRHRGRGDRSESDRRRSSFHPDWDRRGVPTGTGDG